MTQFFMRTRERRTESAVYFVRNRVDEMVSLKLNIKILEVGRTVRSLKNQTKL